MRRLTKGSRLAACAVAASLLAAVPAQAAGLTETTVRPTGPSLSTLSPATLARLQSQSSTTAQAQTQPPDSTADPGSFLKSKKGAAVLVLIGAGFGYTLYSKNHDRVASPIR